jgi:DnaJ-class molecular chaperone
MSNPLSPSRKPKVIQMVFGKRFSIHNKRVVPVVQQTCVRCCGTGYVRERGNRLICKVCAGTGRTVVAAERV